MKLIRAFVNAFEGLFVAFHSQLNLQIHVLAVVVVSLMAWILQIGLTDFLIILLLFAMVISTELLNSCIEEIANFIRDLHKLDYKATKNLRDMAAGAVLVNAIVAAIIGGLIFFKYIS